MHFPLSYEKLFIHINLFLHNPVPEVAMLLYPIQYIIHSTKNRKKESIAECLLCAKHDPESFTHNWLGKCTLMTYCGARHKVGNFDIHPMSYPWVLRQLQEGHESHPYKGKESDQRSELTSTIPLFYVVVDNTWIHTGVFMPTAIHALSATQTLSSQND